MSSSCEAVNASINFESTLVRVPSDSFRYKATLAASSVLMSNKIRPRRRLWLNNSEIGRGSAAPSAAPAALHPVQGDLRWTARRRLHRKHSVLIFQHFAEARQSTCKRIYGDVYM